jgi:hypothetical protein
MDSIKIDKWTIETAQMKHSARKYSMNEVAQTFLRKQAAEYGIDDFQIFLASVRNDPASYETLTDNERDFNDLSSSVGVWATIAGCIKPYIPLSEWLGFDDLIVERLSTAAQEVNPHWFSTQDQEKKTNESPPKLTSELET